MITVIHIQPTNYLDNAKNHWKSLSPTIKKLINYGIPITIVLQIIAMFFAELKMGIDHPSEMRDLNNYILQQTKGNWLTSHWKVLFGDTN